MRTHFVSRVRFIKFLCVMFALLLVGRLYTIAVIDGDEYRLRADRQYVLPAMTIYDRGAIFFEDRDGIPISAATVQSGFTVAINPSILTDLDGTYEALADIIPLDKERFDRSAGKKDDPYEEVAHRVSTTTAKRISTLGIDGVGVYRERWRFYPGGASAAATIGFVAFEGDVLSGQYGLERYYDDVLNRDGTRVYVNFFAELFANIGSAIWEDARPSGDVITWLEPSVELFLEQSLANTRDRWDAREAGGVIIDPTSGAIYALGVSPSFDLNTFNIVADTSIFRNPLVEDVFEMGSIVKPLTLAAGIDAGAVTAETVYNDEGSIALNGATISNYDGKGRGRVSMQEVLNQSLNTGAVFVTGRLGNEALRDYFLSYGLGDETGIDLPNESAGLVNNLDSPRDLEYATASFGQGIAMTPIATVRALSALANGGTLTTPHVGKRIRYKSGISKTISFPDGKRVLKPETSEEITRMLVTVVDDALLGGTVANTHYSIAAKTGTAQIARESGGGYYEDRFLHSFFGYFPAYEPQFLIFLYLAEPKGVRYASQTLTDPFMDIVNFLINYYNIPPDR